ncbi:MAG: helix-turn-helix transcriptional regulator [Actinobacteria bacterium]|nr:helix-turn-helix transcriptional regulator [Actinomycetota bacterium]
MRDRREALGRFGRNLFHARLGAGLSQAALGRRAGISREQVGRLEAGRSECRFLTALRLAEALGIGVEDLFEGISWTPDHYRSDPEGSGG